MRATVTALPGIGDSTIYVSFRTISSQSGTSSEAWDWVLIRSGNTLITLDDGGSVLPSATATNTVMMHMVKDAWQRCAAVS